MRPSACTGRATAYKMFKQVRYACPKASMPCTFFSHGLLKSFAPILVTLYTTCTSLFISTSNTNRLCPTPRLWTGVGEWSLYWTSTMSMVAEVRFELTRLSAVVLEATASANFAIRPFNNYARLFCTTTHGPSEVQVLLNGEGLEPSR